jgi:hypothetical protein
MQNICEYKTKRCKTIIRWKGVNLMSFKHPDKLKKKKNIVKKVSFAPKITNKTIKVKKPKGKS